MAPSKKGLPLPDYLQGKTYELSKERHIKGAVYIVENGRLSSQPCHLCVANDKDCIVDSTRSSRCAWCSFKSMKIKDCQAEGVKPFVETSPDQPNAQRKNTASQNAQVKHKEPKLTTPIPPASADFKNADSVRNAATASQVIAILDSKKIYSNATPDPKQKRKRNIADPDDAPKSATKRTRPTVIEHPYAPTAPPKPKGVSPSFTPINETTPTPDESPTTTDAATATELITAPTTDLVAAHLATNDPSHKPNPGEIIGYITARVKIPVMRMDLGDLEAIPFNSIEREHNMRTENPKGWATLAKDLHTEINNLKRVCDLGPMTNNLIAMMIKDGVWPGPVSNIAAQEE